MVPRPPRVAMLVAGTALLWLAGCADPNGRLQVGSPNEPSTDDLVATCGDVRFDTIPVDPSSFPPVADIAAHVDLPALGMEAGMFREYDWFIARESRRSVVLFGVPPEPPELGPPYASATLRRDGDRWEPRSWGQCRVEVSAPGWGNASFVLDPAGAPDPSADGPLGERSVYDASVDPPLVRPWPPTDRSLESNGRDE